MRWPTDDLDHAAGSLAAQFNVKLALFAFDMLKIRAFLIT